MDVRIEEDVCETIHRSCIALRDGGGSLRVPQSSPDVRTPPRRSVGATREIGRGAGSIATGAVKGTGELAKGTASGALDLVALHPIDAGASVGRGAVVGGKDVAVGAVKGTAQITKGVGKAIRKIL